MNTSLALAVFSHAKHSSAELAACRFADESDFYASAPFPDV